jgi:hypothetical protein
MQITDPSIRRWYGVSCTFYLRTWEEESKSSKSLTDISQHNNLQRSRLRPRNVHPTSESSGVRHAPLPTNTQRLRPRPHARPLRRLPPQPVNTRHERPQKPKSRPPMVHDQRLLICNPLKQRLLHASARQLRRDLHDGVSSLPSQKKKLPSSHPIPIY